MNTLGKSCNHIREIPAVKVAQEHQCTECIRIKSHWLHLRTCQTCGLTLCCDDSPMKHMTAHFHETGHPVITSSEPGERWIWCYADKVFVQY